MPSSVYSNDSPATESEASPAPVTEISPFVTNLVYWLDSGIPVPGTSYRVGVDGIIGLLPAIGDAAGVLIGLVVVGEGVRLKVRKRVLAKMLSNLVADGLVGSVPVAGDLFDFMFKAHKRNYALLEKHVAQKRQEQA